MSATYHKKTVYSLSWGPPCPKAGTFSHFNKTPSRGSFAWKLKDSSSFWCKGLGKDEGPQLYELFFILK